MDTLVQPQNETRRYDGKSPTLSATAPPPAPANLQRMRELTDFKRDSDQLGVFRAAQALYRTGG
jgi:hypothetical protein